MQSTPNLHRVVIVGGGAGGLELATRLGNRLGKRKRAHITLIDANRTHIWKPQLHQLAAGTLEAHGEELEYMAQARWSHFTFRLGRMDGLDRAAKEVLVAPTFDEDGEELVPRQRIPYDTLVLAIGSLGNDFGTPGVQERAIMLDTPEAARRFHHKLLNRCIRAQSHPNGPGEGHLTVCIIGGGATGVELAAELHTTTSILTSYGFEHIDPDRDLKIVVVEGGPRLLPALPERISDSVERHLRSLNIQVHTNERVTAVEENGVRMGSGMFVPSRLVVWAAGIKAADFLGNLDGLETNRANQLVVKPTLQSTRDDDIFVIGDCASYTPDGASRPVPPRAQSAHQMASLLAKSIPRRLAGRSLPTFTYHDFGSLVSLGGYSTVGSLMGGIITRSMFVEGVFAQLVYWSLHKQHQWALNGFFKMAMGTLSEFIKRTHQPKIKLH